MRPQENQSRIRILAFVCLFLTYIISVHLNIKPNKKLPKGSILFGSGGSVLNLPIIVKVMLLFITSLALNGFRVRNMSCGQLVLLRTLSASARSFRTHIICVQLNINPNKNTPKGVFLFGPGGSVLLVRI